MSISPAVKKQIFLFTLIRLYINTGIRMFSPFLPAFGRALGVSLASMSAAVSISTAVSAVVPFFATIADRRGRRIGILLGLGFIAAGAGLVAIWPAFLAMLLALLLINLGDNILIPSINAHLGDTVPYSKRAAVISVTEMSWALAFVLGVPLMGVMIEHLGWQSPFVMMLIMSGLSFLVILRIMPKGSGQPAGSYSLDSIKQVFRSRPAVMCLVMAVLIGTGYQTISLVFGAWMEDSFQMNLTSLGAASIIIGISELSGEVLAAFLTDRLGKERSVVIGLILNTLVVILLPFLGINTAGALIWLFAFYLTYEFYVVSFIPLATEALPDARATLMATIIASFCIGWATGSLLAAWFYQWGFLANVIFGGVLNLVVLLPLSQVKIKA